MNYVGKLEELERDFDAIEAKMADPSMQKSLKELQNLAKRHSQLQPVVDKFREYRKIAGDVEEAKSLAYGSDPEMAELAREELAEKEPLLESVEQQIKVLLLPKDPNDEKSVIMEIWGGAGGEEAALFGADLFRMYSRFAEREGWKIEILDYNETGIGGYREIIFRRDGNGICSKLKFERGVHRVQRVPATEAGGRVHTSTATVAVLPEAEDVEVEINTEDLKIDTYRSSGAGGQYVNMTDSAVRITHLPTGLVVTCQDGRSQLKNRVKAMAYLRAKLYDAQLQKQNDELASERRGQIGTGDRSERIRTYNYSQNRITDHRIGVTLYKLDQYLDGDLYDLVDAMTVADQTERLHTIEAE